VEIHTKDRLMEGFAEAIKPIGQKEQLRFKKFAQGGILKRSFKNGDLQHLSYYVDFRGWRQKSVIGDFQYGVRIDVVEKLYALFYDPLSTYPLENSLTIWLTWGFSDFNDEEKLPKITTTEDLEAAISKFKEVFERKFMPELKHFHSIENLDIHYNGDYQTVIPMIAEHGGFYDKDDFNNGIMNAINLMRSLIIAKMANNPNYDDIVKVYTHRVSKIEYKTFQTQWAALLHYLDTQELPEWQRPW
jgi:hypothetical protein